MGTEEQKGEVTIYTNPFDWGKDNSTDVLLQSALARYAGLIDAAGTEVIESGKDPYRESK